MPTLLTLTTVPQNTDDIDIDSQSYPVVAVADLPVDIQRAVAIDIETVKKATQALKTDPKTADPQVVSAAKAALDTILGSILPTLDPRTVILTDRQKLQTITAITGTTF